MDKVIRVIDKNWKEKLQIALVEYKGHDLVTFRVFAETKDGMIATKKGVTVKVELLPELIAGMQEAEREAVKAGLLERSTKKSAGKSQEQGKLFQDRRA